MDISTGLQNLILQLQSTITIFQVVLFLVAIIAVFSLVMVIVTYSHVRKCEEILRYYIEEDDEE